MTHRLVVLISGSGTNLQAIIDAIGEGRLDARVSLVLSNKADAFGLERAREARIPVKVIANKDFPDREQFDAAVGDAIEAAGADTVVLAGFMRILTAGFVQRFHGRLINIHPSLLPKHRGLHTHARALEAGDREHGCSIHFVTEELDGGPVIAQAVVTVDPNETESTLSHKVQLQEHRLYPEVLNWRAQGRLVWNSGSPALGQDQDGQDQGGQDQGVLLDGKPIPPQGIRLVADATAGAVDA